MVGFPKSGHIYGCSELNIVSSQRLLSEFRVLLEGCPGIVITAATLEKIFQFIQVIIRCIVLNSMILH